MFVSFLYTLPTQDYLCHQLMNTPNTRTSICCQLPFPLLWHQRTRKGIRSHYLLHIYNAYIRMCQVHGHRGIFRLIDTGMQQIRDCPYFGFHEHFSLNTLYEECIKDVYFDHDLPFEEFDLRFD